MSGRDTMGDAAILSRGGAAQSNVFTRIALALFDQVPWRAVPGNHDAREPMRESLVASGWMPALHGFMVE